MNCTGTNKEPADSGLNPLVPEFTPPKHVQNINSNATGYKDMGNVNDTHITETEMDKYSTIRQYDLDFLVNDLDTLDKGVDNDFFETWLGTEKQEDFIYDILLAHQVISLGLPNKMGCRILVSSNWNIELMRNLLQDYDDTEVVDWLMYEFSISQDDYAPDPIPATTNHRGVTEFPEVISQYLQKEIELGATMGPFNIPHF